MNVKVLFFAQLKDLFGANERVVEAKDGCTVRQLTDILADEAALTVQPLPLQFAVNEEFVESHQVLRDADTLALIPPMSGG